MQEKYTMAFSSNNSVVFIVTLKIADFSISFSSIFKIIFILSTYCYSVLVFCLLKERFNIIILGETGRVMRQYLERDLKALRI